MKHLPKFSLASALAAALLLVSASAARADDVPSFKKDKDKDTKEFATKVFEAIIKGTRTSPKDVTLTKYAYSAVKGKEGRKTLVLDGYFKGSVTKKKFTETWTLSLDTSDAKEWEVLKMECKTDHTIGPKQSHINDLIKKFNK